MNRRSFLSKLALGVAALALQFRAPPKGIGWDIGTRDQTRIWVWKSDQKIYFTELSDPSRFYDADVGGMRVTVTHHTLPLDPATAEKPVEAIIEHISHAIEAGTMQGYDLSAFDFVAMKDRGFHLIP